MLSAPDYLTNGCSPQNLKLPVDETFIDLFQASDVSAIVQLIRKNLKTFQDNDSMLSAMLRRLEHFDMVYTQEGHRFYVLKNRLTAEVIGCAGLGTFHGLPVTESTGEIRDLVVAESDRGQGHGTRLILQCLAAAKELGYQRIYLETSPSMVPAKKLFVRLGFRGVTQTKDFPAYFLIDDVRKFQVA